MTTLPNMSLTVPVRGASGSGHWADTLDQDLALLDAHDHSSGKGALVRTAGIGINADLSFGSSWAATALNRVTFSSVAPVAANKSLFVSSTDDELYWRSAAGANVKVTDASSLNVAAFTGGFGGDYTAVSAEAAYDDANLRYTFKQGGGSLWARMASGEVRILETSSSESVYVGLAAPAALAGSYTMAWPLALPASGVQAFTVDNLGVGAFGASFSLAVNNSVTVSGTGVYKHGTKTLVMSYASVVGATTAPTAAAGAGFTTTTFMPVELPIGARILAVRTYVRDNVAPAKVQFTLQTLSSAAVQTTIATSAQSSGAGTDQTLSVTGLTTVVATSNAYTVVMAITAPSSCRWYLTEVDYDQP